MEKNSGTSANLNRGLKASTGQWIKFIAGDDYLLPNCIEEFVKEVNAHPEIQFLFANLAVNGKETISKELVQFFSLTSKEQYKTLLKNNIIPAPAAFIKREVINEINYFDESYRLFDDFPFFLKALKSGIKFYHLNKALVFYRLHENSVSAEKKINLTYYKDVKLFFKNVYLKELRKNGLIVHYLHYMLEYTLLWFISKELLKSYKLYSNIRSWFSPLHWTLRIQKRLPFLD